MNVGDEITKQQLHAAVVCLYTLFFTS